MTAAGQITIAVETESVESVRALVLAGLRLFNREHAEPPHFQQLTLAARDPGGTVVGGLVGETEWGWLHVSLLWVAPPLRGRGVGRRLLGTAEREAMERRCVHAYLDTFDFQARPFYERLGYTVFGVQDEFPPGHRRFYLRKTLTGGEAVDA